MPEEDGDPNFGLVPVVAPGRVDPEVPVLLLDGDPNFGLEPVVELGGLELRVGELKLGFLAGLLLRLGGLLLRLGELKLLLPPLLLGGLAATSKTRPPTNSRHTIAVRIRYRFIVRSFKLEATNQSFEQCNRNHDRSSRWIFGTQILYSPIK